MFYRFYAKAHLAANQTLSWHEWSVGSQGFSQPLAPVLLLEDFFLVYEQLPPAFLAFLLGQPTLQLPQLGKHGREKREREEL